jgi:cytochrome c oxidase cbb3-type subunit III
LRKRVFAVCVVAALGVCGIVVHAQGRQAPPAPAQPAGAAGRGRGTVPAGEQGGGGYADAYPQRPPADPAVVERGKTLYAVNCAFCHGPDARGGDGGGPNLLRSQLVLSDQNGELIAEVVENGRPNATPPMPPVKLTRQQVADIATFIHSFRVGGYDITRQPPVSILVGNAAAGAAAFSARCGSCHSVTGDLKGIATRFPDARDLQQAWIMPDTGGRGGAAPPKSRTPTAVVTLPAGGTVQGRVIRIDDFVITIEQADGTPRSFTRRGDVPKVEITDPLKPHRDLLPKYTDKEIHDITAFLATVK